MFKLAIENSVEVPVKFTLKEGKVDKLFSFNLLCDRLDQDEIGTVLDENEHKVKAFMTRVTRGWDGQRLVLTEDGQPADFSPTSARWRVRKKTSTGRAPLGAWPVATTHPRPEQ